MWVLVGNCSSERMKEQEERRTSPTWKGASHKGAGKQASGSGSSFLERGVTPLLHKAY
jgi:hypothetical protein